MPDIGALHPIVVHFVIALLFVGVIARVVSLLPNPRLAFAGPMAAVLILIGTGAAIVAVQSGADAHDAAERVPGARDAVMEHEEWGERARNAFLVVAALELVLLAVRARPAAKVVRAAAAVAGLGGLVVVFEAGEHGGDVVYRYAGGVGIRSGDTTDVRHLMVAALYHTAMLERAAGHGDSAYALFEQLARRRPESATHFLRVESLIRDRKDPQAALEVLAGWIPPLDDERLSVRHGLLTAQAFEAAGQPDSARERLTALQARFPQNGRLRDALAKLGGG